MLHHGLSKTMSNLPQATTQNFKPWCWLMGVGRIRDLRSYLNQHVSSLEYGKCRDAIHALMPMQCFIHARVNFERTIRFFPLKIFVSCIL